MGQENSLPIHTAIGISYFRTGYFIEENAFGIREPISWQLHRAAVVARHNIANKNYMYVDVGLNPFYLASATLEEGITEFGQFRSVKADITRYSGRLFIGYRFQFYCCI